MSNEGDVLIRKVGGRISSERHVKMITGKNECWKLNYRCENDLIISLALISIKIPRDNFT